MYKVILSLIVFLSISLFTFGQDKWDFSNSTPQKLVKSHFYFLEKGHKNVEIAIFTMADIDYSTKRKERRLIKLKQVLLALNIDINSISNRRKGIINNNKYVLIQGIDKIYLVRESRKWYYSIETIESVPDLYNKYVLKQKGQTNKISKNSLDKELNESTTDSVAFELNLATPYLTVLSHLVFTDDSLFNSKKAAECINFSIEDTANAEELAIKLKQIYLGISRKIFDFKTLSKDTFELDSASNTYIYWPNKEFRELYLEKVGDKWLYSHNTSKLIASIHANIYDADAEAIFNFSDKFKKAGAKFHVSHIGKLQVWQILMILYFFIILVIIHFINKYIIKNIIIKFIKKKRWNINLYQLINAIIFLITFNSIGNYGPSFAFDMSIQPLFLQFIALAEIFVSTLIAIYSVNLLVLLLTKEDSYDNRFGLVFFLGLLAKVVIFTTSLLFVIDALDYNLINFLAGLSIGGFALALGAQDTIKNFFGSLMIFADDSFNVGDWIKTEFVSGTVEKIGLRSTRVRTFHNSLVTVPNSKLSDNNIDNMGKRMFRRYSGKILLDYATDNEKIELFIKKIKEHIKTNDNIRNDFYMVYVSELDTYGIEILIYVFFKVADWDQEMAEKHKLLLKVLAIKNELDIKFTKLPLFEKIEN